MARSKGDVGSLEVDQDEGVQRREWRFERIGWGALALLLLAGVLGMFGDGPLSSVTAAAPGGGAVARYERVMRHGANSEIEVLLPAAGPADTLAVVSLDEEYLDGVEVQRVEPEPLQVGSSAGRVEYQLRRREPAQPLSVVFVVQPSAVGARHTSLGTSHGSIPIRQLILP